MDNKNMPESSKIGNITIDGGLLEEFLILLEAR
jgi:hypothetical protein